MFLAVVSVQAQMSFGAKAGANMANIEGDDWDTDGRTALFLGAYARIGISESLSFQPELLYSAKGFKNSESESGDGYSYSYESVGKLNYLDIPLMLNVGLTEAFYLQAGPQLSLLLSAEDEWEWTETEDGESDSGSGTDDMKESLKGMDFGIGVGAAYDFDFGLGVFARYNLGLSNISDVESEEGESDISMKNKVFQIGLSYAF